MSTDYGIMKLVEYIAHVSKEPVQVNCFDTKGGCGECPACKLRKRGLESFLNTIEEAEND